MKLVKAQVTNYRSVEDSGEFIVDDLVCLVGKNEAGKTAILQAISGINPHPLTPIAYDKERDYPRRYLTAYSQRHPDGPAVVATTWWEPGLAARAEIAAQIGPDGLKDEPVQIYRRYEDKAAEWEAPIDYPKAVAFLIADERLDGTETEGLSMETSDELLPSP
jgi:hypothetical protein